MITIMVQLSDITALILAGGKGTMLRSVVADIPKPLASVAGKPFITYLFEQLLFAGLKKVVIASGYLGEQLYNHLGVHYKKLALHYSKEPFPLGTAGALRHALPYIEARQLLVLNGDSFCDVNLAALSEYHSQTNAHITLTTVEVPDVSRYGSVHMGSDGIVADFIEKGVQSGRGYINAGVYLLDTSVVEGLDPDTPCSLENDVLPTYCNNGMYSFKTNGTFIDIGIPDDYAHAQQIFTQKIGGSEKP